MQFYIALAALTEEWGIITHLAKAFHTNRGKIYALKTKLIEALSSFFTPTKEKNDSKSLEDTLKAMLVLRLEGKCSIESIHLVMKRLGFSKFASHGSISEILTYAGNALTEDIDHEQEEIQYLIAASDEIYAHSTAVLITVDPQSTAILRMEKVDTLNFTHWENHWTKIKINNCSINVLVNDNGKVMRKAQKNVLPDVLRQSDTFHAFPYKWGDDVKKLERKAYQAIGKEEKMRIAMIKASYSAKSKEAYEKARNECEKQVEIYDALSYLYDCMIKILQVFDKDGTLNTREEAENTVEAALELIEELSGDTFKKHIRATRTYLHELFVFLDQAREIVEKLNEKDLEEDAMRLCYTAWQYHKNMIKSKKAGRRQYFKKKEQDELELLKLLLDGSFSEIKEDVYWELNAITQSSAIIENINSIIRMYLNTTKNHITQPFLNLIRFYLNHRRFTAGERKGKTPLELLTGKTQNKDWLEMLMETIDWQGMSFFDKKDIA